MGLATPAKGSRLLEQPDRVRPETMRSAQAKRLAQRPVDMNMKPPTQGAIARVLFHPFEVKDGFAIMVNKA
jgi:hypothetical protein